MEILVTQRQVYGVPAFYPVNEAAKTLAAIARTTTLRPADLALAIKLGHTVREAFEPADLSLDGLTR